MKKLQGNMRMNKYEQFDISMSRLKEIEKEDIKKMRLNF